MHRFDEAWKLAPITRTDIQKSTWEPATFSKPTLLVTFFAFCDPPIYELKVRQTQGSRTEKSSLKSSIGSLNVLKNKPGIRRSKS